MTVQAGLRTFADSRTLVGMRRSATILLLLGSSTLAGCTMQMSGLRVEKTALSDVRPESTIGPTEDDGPWQTFRVTAPSQFVRRLLAMQSTFHLQVKDCRFPHAGRLENGRFDETGWVTVEDVYVDGLTLNGSSGRRTKLAGSSGPIVTGVAYVSTSRISSTPELCFQAVGGSMMGAKFQSNIVRLRTADN